VKFMEKVSRYRFFLIMKSGKVVCIVVQSQIHITMLPFANMCYLCYLVISIKSGYI